MVLTNKKAEVFCFPLLIQHAGFLFSPKGPPSCWRAKPKVKAELLVCSVAEHVIIPFFLKSDDYVGSYLLRL